MQRTLIVLALLTLVAPLSAQQEGFEMRFFDPLTHLTRGVPQDRLDVRLPLHIAYFPTEDSMEAHHALEVDQVIDLIRENVATESWDREGTDLGRMGEHLFATNDPAVLDEVGRFLRHLDHTLGRQATLTLYALADDVDGGRFDGGVVRRDAVKRLVKEGRARLVGRVRVSNGRTARLRAGNHVSFIADYDVEVAKKEDIADPVVRVIRDGLDVWVRTWTTTGTDRIVQLYLREASLESLESQDTASPGEGRVQTPGVACSMNAVTARVPDGDAVVFGATVEGSTHVYLARLEGDGPPKGYQGDLRLIPVGALVTPPVPMAPFSMTPWPEGDCEEPEETVFIGRDELMDLVRHRADRSWEEHETRRLDSLPECLVVKAEAPFADKAVGVVREIQDRLVRNVSLEFRFGLVPAARAADLVDGGVFVEEVADDIAASAFITTLSGHQFRNVIGRERAYLKDYAVEVAEDASARDPVVSTIFRGAAISGRVACVGDRVSVDAHLVLTDPGSIRSFPVGGAGGKALEMPRASVTQLRIQEVLSRIQWTVISITSPFETGESLVVLARAMF